MQMDFYEIEYILQELEDHDKEEEKRYKKEEQEIKKTQAQNKPGKTDYGGFKVPKVSLPTIPKPKF
jgi:hypothetical protein